MKSISTQRLTVVFAAALLTACSPKAQSTQLETARTAYEEASASRASALAPDHLLEAKRALDEAERAQERHAAVSKVDHLAYLAARRAQMAIQVGEIRNAEDTIRASAVAYQRLLEQRVAQLRGKTLHEQRNLQMAELERIQSELAQVREELKGRGNRLDEQTEKLRLREQELAAKTVELEAARKAKEQETAARIAAEERAEAALRSLEQVAKVKSEERGLIITISGSLLFKSNESELMPIALNRLNQVATALMQMEKDRMIRVEGHTDSRGSAAYNERLSLARAESVRTYLIGRGVPETRIEAVGKGETMPIASNASPEGRANNRRVEIIVAPLEAEPRISVQ